MDYLIEVGNTIKRRRTEKGISQQELAEAVGYSQKGMISQIESGKVNLPMDKALAIADYLGMKPSELLRPKQTVIVQEQLLDGLTEEEIKKVVDYVQLLKGANRWQQQNGTASAGGSESHKADR